MPDPDSFEFLSSDQLLTFLPRLHSFKDRPHQFPELISPFLFSVLAGFSGVGVFFAGPGFVVFDLL